MSFNGSGTFAANSAGLPVVTATVISSTMMNALTADIATGLSTVICKDGQTVTTARIPFLFGITSTLTTESTSTTTGSILTSGGIGCAKQIISGGSISVGAVTNFAAFTSFTKCVYVAGDADQYGYVADAAGAATEAPTILLRKASGNQVTRTNVVNADQIAVIGTNSYCGATGYWANAQIIAVVDGAVTDNQRPPSRWDFYANAANTSPAVVFALDSSGPKFGTHTGLGAETVTGFITIKDAAGNSRKLAVVS